MSEYQNMSVDNTWEVFCHRRVDSIYFSALNVSNNIFHYWLFCLLYNNSYEYSFKFILLTFSQHVEFIKLF